MVAASARKSQTIKVFFPSKVITTTAQHWNKRTITRAIWTGKRNINSKVSTQHSLGTNVKVTHNFLKASVYLYCLGVIHIHFYKIFLRATCMNLRKSTSHDIVKSSYFIGSVEMRWAKTSPTIHWDAPRFANKEKHSEAFWMMWLKSEKSVVERASRMTEIHICHSLIIVVMSLKIQLNTYGN